MIETSPDLTREQRRAHGVYYTPAPLIDYLVPRTLGRWLRGRSLARAAVCRVLDPACGAGDFLVRACRYLLAWHRRARGRTLTPAARERLLLAHVFGVDIDRAAVERTRKALRGAAALIAVDLRKNVLHGNALVGTDFPGAMVGGLDWAAAFPGGGFDVVLGNPPWGQKGIAADAALKRYLWERFPSAAGIFDWFRPFVEQAVHLLRDGGFFGFVLPDILLLKNYEPTRRLLLDQLRLDAIDWWGRAFPGAVIDTVTILGQRSVATTAQRVRVAVRSGPDRSGHVIPQADFRANPRSTFNLFLTPARRRIVDSLAALPRLGEFFEVHEGVHSGNLRAALFVRDRLDESCRELLFGRDEIEPYRLTWRGLYLRLAAVPARKTPQAYANVGRPEWHGQPKLLVRRTGDRVLAAVDRLGRYASNNFFVVLPRRPCALNLDGLCAVLNSQFMTWYFRTVEPRPGRTFAELKIKHLTQFPVPAAVLDADGCRRLNELGARRADGEPLDGAIDDAACQALECGFLRL